MCACYLQEEHNGAQILDVGIGNAQLLAALANLHIITEKNITMDGEDINSQSLEIANVNIKRYGMSERITAQVQDIFKFEPSKQ